jgi:hypothetical protein
MKDKLSIDWFSPSESIMSCDSEQLDPELLEPSWSVLKNKVILVQERVIDLVMYQWPVSLLKNDIHVILADW